LHKSHNSLIRTIYGATSQVSDQLEYDLLMIRNEARKVLVKVLEYSLRGHVKDREKAMEGVRALHTSQLNFVIDRMVVDFVKIDGSFVRTMLEDEMDGAIVEAINTIGHIAGSQTIAEFVENDAVLKQITDLGVDFAQGWAVDYPQPLLINP